MVESSSEERRQNKRFCVKGLLRLQTSGGVPSQNVCEVLNVSSKGVLFLTKNPPIAGTNIEFRFTIEGYNNEIQAKGRVVREDSNLAVIEFTGKPKGIDELVNWLESESIGSIP
jgi:hypothetical protein